MLLFTILSPLLLSVTHHLVTTASGRSLYREVDFSKLKNIYIYHLQKVHSFFMSYILSDVCRASYLRLILEWLHSCSHKCHAVTLSPNLSPPPTGLDSLAIFCFNLQKSIQAAYRRSSPTLPTLHPASFFLPPSTSKLSQMSTYRSEGILFVTSRVLLS